MSKTQSLQLETFGHYAHRAISQHFKKSIKPEAAVLRNEDPEPLHQMRVGMRRLRTALEVFDPCLELPKAASTKRIGKIARELGTVRDADVMVAELEAIASSDLKPKEREQIEKVLKTLQQQRQQNFAHLEKILTHRRYQQFKQTLQDWLKHPTYKELADLPISSVLPDLLLPLISKLLLHPGWLFGTTTDAGKVTLSKIDPSALSELLEQQGEALHDLRKQMKRVRYQTEFFLDFYSPAYAAQSQEFQTVQKILGEVQDSLVLGEFFTDHLKTVLDQELPAVAEQLQQGRAKAWQAWQPIQQRYLDPAFRQFLRQQVATPSVLALDLAEVS